MVCCTCVDLASEPIVPRFSVVSWLLFSLRYSIVVYSNRYNQQVLVELGWYSVDDRMGR